MRRVINLGGSALARHTPGRRAAASRERLDRFHAARRRCQRSICILATPLRLRQFVLYVYRVQDISLPHLHSAAIIPRPEQNECAAAFVLVF